MRTRRLSLGVALLVCLLLAVGADAQKKVERPFTMTGHSQGVITLAADCDWNTFVGCPYEGHGEGVASHLGRITTTDSGFFPIGEGEIVAANGDRLMFDSNNATGSMTITGGTGRFEGASGDCSGVLTLEGMVINYGTVTLKLSWTITGAIAY